MKLSVTMYSFSDCVKNEQMTVKDFINLVASYNIEGVDLLNYYWKDREKEIEEIPKLLADTGLTLSSFCIGNNFIVEPEERIKQIENVKVGIRTAARLGASKLRVFGGHWVNSEGKWEIPKNANKSEWIKIIIDCLSTCVDCARENNVVLALENHNHLPLTIAETLEIMETLNSPYIKLNFDIGNFFVSAEEDPVKAAEILSKYVVHVHVKDAVASTTPGRKYNYCPVGCGVIPVEDTLKVLKRNGYDGYVSVEYEGWKFMESKTAVRKSLEYLKEI